MSNHSRSWFGVVCSAALLSSAASASAETLADALALAYQSNPTLQSQRALQRQIDETYVQARAGIRPTANASSSASYSNGPDQNGAGYVDRNILGVTLSASQPLFTGGRTAAAVDVAEATVLAGRENLRAVEQTVLQAVIQSYQDVIRDTQIVGIREQSVQVLGSQLTETRARFEVGLLTLTDVARAEAQVANARAQLTTAKAQLQNSRAAYVTAVGQNPGELAQAPTLAGLPATVDEAFKLAEAENPTLRRAQIGEQASRYRVAQVRAQRNPTVSLQGSIGNANGSVSPFDLGGRQVSISGVITQPLFTGGVISSQIRGALEQNTSDRILIEQARRTTVQSVAQAWNQMQAALGNIASNQEQVRAQTVAFEGTQEQFRVGLSTTLDVLLTQETLRLAQLALVQSQRDLYVAQATLLNAMGRLDARSLVQNASLYDPERNFQRVKNAGAVPWEPLVEALDSLASPAAADPTRPIPVPPAPTGAPVLAPTTVTPTEAAGFSSVTPTVPSGAAAIPGAPPTP